MGHIIQTIQSILSISDEKEKSIQGKFSSIFDLNKIIANTALGIELNLQCDEAIDNFKKKYDV